MGAENRVRAALNALTRDDIALVAAVPGLGKKWAGFAKVRQADLEKGLPRAVIGVRTAIMKNPQPFAQTLAQLWENAIVDAIKSPSSAFDYDGEYDDLSAGAWASAHAIGSSGAKAFLCALAESQSAVAGDVARRLDELLALTDDPPRTMMDLDQEIDSIEPTIADHSLSDDDEADSGGADESVGCTANGPSADMTDLKRLMAQVDSLMAAGLVLAEQLRAAADLVERGNVTEPVTTDSWSESVRSLLAEAVPIAQSADLAALREQLVLVEADLVERETKQYNDAVDALQIIEMLKGQGRDEMVDAILDRFGFSSIAEVESIAQGESRAEESMPPASPMIGEPTDAVDEAKPAEHQAAQKNPIDSSAPRNIVGDPSTQESETCLSVAKMDSGREATITEPQQAEPTEQFPSTDDVAEKGRIPRVDVKWQEDCAGAHTAGHCTDTGAEVGKDTSTVNNLSAPFDEFPWDAGDPPLIGQLLLDGREALAYQLAVATGETAARRRLLELSCAAAGCARDALELALSELLPSEAEIKQFDANENRLLLAAALRAGLRLGYAPLGLQSLLDAADLAPTGMLDIMTATATAVQRGNQRWRAASATDSDELTTRWAEFAEEATQQLDTLRRRVLKLQRGSKVIHQLAKEGQPLGQALTRVADLTSQGVSGASSVDWPNIEQFAADLRDHGKRVRLINDADAEVSSSQQLRRSITAGVERQLHDCLTTAGDLLSRVCAVRRAILSAGDLKDIASAEDLDRALGGMPHGLAAHTVGDAALIALVDWLRDYDVDPVGASVASVTDAALLELFELPRDEEGRPAQPPTPAEVLTLLEPRDPHLVVSGYLAKGDIAAARQFVAGRGLEGAGYDDEILRAVKAARIRFEQARAEAEQGAARLRALYQDEIARELSERVDKISGSLPHDRFDLAIASLKLISSEAEQALSKERSSLEARANALVSDEDGKARVLDRLDQGDETLAVEFLTMLENGQQLPEAKQPPGDDFSEFFPRIVEVAARAQADGGDAVAAVRQALSVTGDPSDRQLRDGLSSWMTIKKQRRGGDDFRTSLANVLRMVGLVPRSQNWSAEISRTKNAGYATFRVSGNPVDRSYVPQLGTQARSSYDVTLVWDRVTSSRLMDFIDERNTTRPNIFFYFGVLSPAERLHLRALTRATGGKGFSPLVIDDAVIGWLSSRAEPGWRFTQRVTLPFTTVNPYSPHAAGEVPEEVFVGRAEERDRIENPTGSMFVYGGRQLGKSALLRRVERLYTDPRPDDTTARTGRVAVYIDLKAAGIGESQEPAKLWPLLAERLRELGVVSSKNGRRVGVNEVTSDISEWLKGEAANRLLVLLDEADYFLTADANWGDRRDRGGFPVLQALKGLMELSDRRFKVVFAGLHQVQRFHDTSNTPVAHGGDDILIGPLKNSDAYDLVVDPMTALGYRFDSPESVWRLLLITNYQASLVQIVCEALVKHLQNRQIPEAGGRIAVTANDIRDVCANPKVRELIAQRFRWTINLDSRYRVIALVVALNSLDSEPGATFSVDDVREECETWWPAGFNPNELSRNEFERYLVEMKGLGILDRREDRWGLRSPNIIQMLGTPERLEKELQDAPAHLEPPVEYNPAMARQIIGDSEGIAAPRSPLTDQELASLLNADARVQVVFGSDALGIDRVTRVLEQFAQANWIDVVTVQNAQASELKQIGTGRKRTHVIVDLSGQRKGGDLARLCRELSQKRHVTATIVLGSAFLESRGALSVPVLALRRWSIAGLRAWYGSPFEGPEARTRLHRVTSGWPKLIEEVMADISRGLSQDDALDRLETRLRTVEGARQLLIDCGIAKDVCEAWVTWFVTSGPDGVVQLPVCGDDVSEAMDLDGTQLLRSLESLDVVTSEGDSWALDAVVLAAAVALHNE
ncbi:MULTISPECIES: ATP-binding protein [Mycobacteriaceae]|uniref:ATP-binding protein n=1 Tax=Mycobacteriaceae TaxID=1762 RepID=UPI00114E24AD|nr:MULTISPECIES: ATP-binding protein [Mycobacteriaceae]